MANPPNYNFLTVDDLASVLQISRGSAYNLLKNGEIKSFKIGSHYKIMPEAIDEYIQRMTILPRGVHYDK